MCVCVCVCVCASACECEWGGLREGEEGVFPGSFNASQPSNSIWMELLPPPRRVAQALLKVGIQCPADSSQISDPK